jgi:hypothetical protein
LGVGLSWRGCWALAETTINKQTPIAKIIFIWLLSP